MSHKSFRTTLALIVLINTALVAHADQYSCENESYYVSPLQFRHVEGIVPPFVETDEEKEDMSLFGISVDGDDIVRDDLERYIYDTYPDDHRLKSILYRFPIIWHNLVKSWSETGKGSECFWMHYLIAEAKLRNELAMDLAPPEGNPHNFRRRYAGLAATKRKGNAPSHRRR
jgi:hypothetical protein